MIRRAEPDDAGAILGLVEEFYLIDGHVFDRDVVVRGLTPLLESDDHGVVLLEDAAYAVVTWSYSLESGGQDALVDELFVRHTGQGTGAALMEAVFDEARARGITKVFLETESANSAARRFYERIGFQVDDSIWMSVDIG